MSTIDQYRSVNWDVQKQLTGPSADADQVSAVDELKECIKERGLAFSYNNKTLTDSQMAAMLASMLPAPVMAAYGADQGMDRHAVDHIKLLVQSYNVGSSVSAENFYMLAHVYRLDGDVIDAFKAAMGVSDKKKEGFRNDLTRLSAELKIYGVIQSTINAAIAKKEDLNIDSNGINLNDKNLYGYKTQEEFMVSPEGRFLEGLDDWPGWDAKGTIKDFLLASPKESGAMVGLLSKYEYKADQNPLASFATSVGDRSRPVSDKVSEKTTLLNDASSRYNASTETLNKFIAKYNDMLTGILRAI